MKASRLFLLILLLPLIAFWGCEGDQGPAGPAGADGADGTDGTDGVDGNVTCLDCHSTANMVAISYQFDRSQHNAGTIAVDYAGGRASCAKCHSGNGYVEWAETGTVDGDLTTPEPWECGTCHAVHESFEVADFALRKADPVEWIYDDGATPFDFGDNSNVCAWCHQSRRAEPNVAAPGATFDITSTHYGPHHGAMANVVAGLGFAEIPGDVAYPTGPFGHFAAGINCVDCHMGEYADGEGGHTWLPALATCQTTGCHSSATDFDIGSTQSDTQVQLDTLRDLLLDQGVIEWVVEDEAYEPVVGTYSMEQAQAFFNWIGISEDRSLGVHNPPYVNALLENSIQAITP